MTNNKWKVAAFSALLAAVMSAHAQSIRPTYQFPVPPTGSGPASVQMGGSPFFFAPYLGVAIGRDDNVLISNTNERSSTLYVVSPGFKIDARDPNKVFQLSYQGQIGRYSSSEEDNYVDHALRGQFDIAMDRRNFLRLGAEYIRSHDPRGTTDRPVLGNPDEYRLTTPSVTYAFGAPGADGRVELYASDARKRYTNNRATTVLGDRNHREFGGAFYFRVAPRTYAVAEARSTKIKFIQASTLNADERRYYGGLAWDATATTTGIVKVGRFQRNFDASQPDYSGVGWEAAITWAPRTYSKFEFYTSRHSTESSGLGSFILSSTSGVSWNHSWSSVFTTGVDVKFQKDEYQNFNRTDDTMVLGLRAGYKVRRWLTLGAEYTHTQRDSNQNSSEYDKNLYLLTATASM